MHLRTHVRAEHRGRYKHGDSEYVDGMLEHDDTVGTLLKALDDMGIANNTIVVYTSDNGPHMNTWPDGAMTWFRSEKNTNWEGAFRVPCLVRWPGVIQPGTVTNELMSHNDWVPTLCAIAGEPDIVNKLQAGYTANGINYKVHLDGYDQSAFLRSVSGTAANNNGAKSARDKFFYSDDDGLLVGDAEGRLQIRLRRAARARARCRSGPSHSRSCACRRSSTCSRTRSSGPTSRPIPSGTGNLNHVGQIYGVMDEVFTVRGDVQGVSTALVPAELRADDGHGGDARRHQGREAAWVRRPGAALARAPYDRRARITRRPIRTLPCVRPRKMRGAVPPTASSEAEIAQSGMSVGAPAERPMVFAVAAPRSAGR